MGPKWRVSNLTGHDQFHRILLKTCSLGSWDPMWRILDYYTIFINFGSIPNFGEKIENFSKIRFREIFSVLNPLEKIQKISWKNFQKFSKISFFFGVS